MCSRMFCRFFMFIFALCSLTATQGMVPWEDQIDEAFSLSSALRTAYLVEYSSNQSPIISAADLDASLPADHIFATGVFVESVQLQQGAIWITFRDLPRVHSALRGKTIALNGYQPELAAGEEVLQDTYWFCADASSSLTDLASPVSLHSQGTLQKGSVEAAYLPDSCHPRGGKKHPLPLSEQILSALNATAGIRSVFEVEYFYSGRLPLLNDFFSANNPVHFPKADPYLSSVEFNDGAFIVTYRNAAPVETSLRGKSIVFLPLITQQDNVVWFCPGADNTLADFAGFELLGTSFKKSTLNASDLPSHCNPSGYSSTSVWQEVTEAITITAGLRTGYGVNFSDTASLEYVGRLFSYEFPDSFPVIGDEGRYVEKTTYSDHSFVVTFKNTADISEEIRGKTVVLLPTTPKDSENIVWQCIGPDDTEADLGRWELLSDGTQTASFQKGTVPSRFLPAYCKLKRQALTLSDAPLSGTAGVAYRHQLVASGEGKISFMFQSGDFPIGLKLSPSGEISGTPRNSGTFTFTARAEDQYDASKTQTYTLTIQPSAAVLAIAPVQLETWLVENPVQQALTVSGGAEPYTFTVTSGALPAGITLTEGSLKGAATAAGDGTFTLQVVDANEASATQEYTWKVVEWLIAPKQLVAGKIGENFEQQITLTGGTAPYSFDVFAGRLPAGMTLSETGMLSGTPEMAGDFPFVLRVRDAEQASYKWDYRLVIAPAADALQIAPTALTAGKQNEAYAQTLTASGGSAPYQFSLKEGTLPAGITLTETGEFAGTPTEYGDFPLTIEVKDQAGKTAAYAFTLQIETAWIYHTLPALTTTITALAPADCELKDPGLFDEKDFASFPATQGSAKSGFTAFTLDCVTAGMKGLTTEITLTYEDFIPTDAKLLVFNRTTQAWHVIAAVIDGKSIIYHVTEGDILDEDSEQNGTLKHLAGYVIYPESESVPLFNMKWLLLLASLLVGLTWNQRRLGLKL